MVINFLLPGPARTPGGGHKIIYQYADRLAARGHQITILHPLKLNYLPYKNPYLIRWIAHHFLRSARASWFNFENKVQRKLVHSLTPTTIPNADVTVATYWETAFSLNALSIDKGVGFYFIQGYEIWNGYEDKVLQSYHLPLKKIVIANWLKKKWRISELMYGLTFLTRSTQASFFPRSLALSDHLPV